MKEVNMQEQYDWWSIQEPIIDTRQIQILNKIILKNCESDETPDRGATDKEGNYLKNIKPKNIILKHLPDSYNNILSMAFNVCHYKFGFNTFPPSVWDELLYNVYSGDVKGRYGEHHDGSKLWSYDIKMTFLLNLSEEPYEGGDFIIDKKPQHFFREPGTAILFKSHLKHEVTPVTKGERKSLTYFICGPKFQ